MEQNTTTKFYIFPMGLFQEAYLPKSGHMQMTALLWLWDCESVERLKDKIVHGRKSITGTEYGVLQSNKL